MNPFYYLNFKNYPLLFNLKDSKDSSERIKDLQNLQYSLSRGSACKCLEAFSFLFTFARVATIMITQSRVSPGMWCVSINN